MLQLIKSGQVLDNSLFLQLPRGLWRGLFVRWTGTNAGGQAVNLAQLGTVRVNLMGTDIVNCLVSFLSALGNLKSGVAEFASATGGAYAASVYIPFHTYFDLQNSLYAANDESIQIELRNTVTTAIVTGGTVEVYALQGIHPMRYVPTLINQNVQAGGAGLVSDIVQSRNVSSLYVTDNAQLSIMQVETDGRLRINANRGAIGAFSNFENRVETAITLFELNLNPHGIVSDALSDTVKVMFQVSAATTVLMHYNAILYSPVLQEESNKEAIRKTIRRFEEGARTEQLTASNSGVPTPIKESTTSRLVAID